jgi:Immunoglobulin domain
MNPRLTQALRLPSLFLAAALQVFPIVRAALPAAQTATNVLAIVFRWTAGAAAALGSVQAVSGASTVISNPLSTNITVNVPWQMRLITAPQQATYWSATGLPPGVALTGKNGSSLWYIGGTPTTVGTFNVGLTAKSSASAGASETTTATLVITVTGSSASPPTITSQPSNQTVSQGQSASFSVTATGTAPLTYYWRKGTTVVSSGNSSSYTIASAQAADAGSYSVIISNSAGTVTSSTATLTVNIPPSIITQPADQNVNQGQSATFSVTATGTAPLTYYWRKGSTVVSVGSSASYTIPSAQTSDAGNYSVVVSNLAGTVTSSAATLAVNLPATPPAITAQPANQTVAAGQSATFSVSASGTAPLTYYWFKSATVVSVSGNSSYTIPSAQAADAGTYSVIVSNSVGTAASSTATLTVNPAPIPPSITSQPASQYINPGETATFAVTATGTGPLTYLWRKGTAMLAANNSATLTILNAKSSDAGNYSVIVTNAGGSVTSVVATLTVNVNVALPAVGVRGWFEGLYYESTGVSRLSAGYAKIITTDSRWFSGRLLSSLGRFGFHGQFDTNGNATVTIHRRAPATPLTLQLLLDPAGDLNEITGTVSDGFWTSELAANRAAYDRRTNPAPQAGSYTLVFPGTPGATGSPAGYGYGIVRVDTSGRVRFIGVLADGSRVSQSTTLSSLGQWPCFGLLYSGRGLVMGWLTLADRTQDDLYGLVHWSSPVKPTSLLFGSGFKVETQVIGSKFTRPARGQTVLSYTNGVVTLTDGGFTQPLATTVTVAPNNRVTSPDNRWFLLALNTSTGMFTGRTLDPDTNRSLLLRGVVLQKRDAGYGFFLRANQSGAVYFGK